MLFFANIQVLTVYSQNWVKLLKITESLERRFENVFNFHLSSRRRTKPTWANAQYIFVSPELILQKDKKFSKSLTHKFPSFSESRRPFPINIFFFTQRPIYIWFIWPRRKGPPLTTDKKLQNWVHIIIGDYYITLLLGAWVVYQKRI